MNGVDWHWNIGTYCDLLKKPGGKKRLLEYSENQLSSELVEQIHKDKQVVFEELIGVGLKPRVGCLEAFKKCKDNGGKVGFVTTTTPYTIEIIRKSLSKYIDFEDFDIITSCETVSQPKPSSAVYEYVLSQLKLDPKQTIAIEDTKVNQNAAIESGLVCYLYPGEYSNFDYDDINHATFISDGDMMPKLLLHR